MKQWFKKWLLHTFLFVERSEYERIWMKWLEVTRICQEGSERFETVSELYTRTALALEREKEAYRKLIMELAIVNVGPLETMDRTLDILKLNCDPSEAAGSPIQRAIRELERGLELLRSFPSVKGALYGNYRSPTAH